MLKADPFEQIFGKMSIHIVGNLHYHFVVITIIYKGTQVTNGSRGEHDWLAMNRQSAAKDFIATARRNLQACLVEVLQFKSNSQSISFVCIVNCQFDSQLMTYA